MTVDRAPRPRRASGQPVRGGIRGKTRLGFGRRGTASQWSRRVRVSALLLGKCYSRRGQVSRPITGFFDQFRARDEKFLNRADIGPALKEAIEITGKGAPCLVEIIAKEGYDFSREQEHTS